MERFQCAFDATLKRLEHIGGEDRTQHSHGVKSSKEVVEETQMEEATKIGTGVERDLGAHFNSSGQGRYGAMLTNRMRTVTRSASRLARMRTNYKTKASTIRANMLSNTVSGCEVAPINETAMRTLRKEIVGAVAFSTTIRATGSSFATCSYGNDTDPDIHVYLRRVRAFRRAYSEEKIMKDAIEDICDMYLKASRASSRKRAKATKNRGARN